jgi:hypothetical protein
VLVGFDAIEQYLPHRVAMQFGMDQDVPSYVPKFNETESVVWKNYFRPISNKNLYFPCYHALCKVVEAIGIGSWKFG